MKKSLLALAALTAFAGAASAQSSVTLFGIVDVAAQNIKNGSATWNKLAQDGINSSRLGFRGVEDLGGGLRAGFWLEGALNPDTGTSGGQTWTRRSTVSLLGGFGEVRLGRDYTPSFWNYTIFDVFGTNGIGSSLNVGGLANSNAGNTLVRANNSIGYFLPSLGGVYGQVMVAAPEGTGLNKYMGGRIGYGAGPVNVAVAYGKNSKNGTLTADVVDWNVGASYNLGFMSIQGYYAKSTTTAASTATFPSPNAAFTATTGVSKAVKQYNLGVAIPVGAGTIQATYNNADVEVATGTEKAKQYAFGYQYDLSKRTAVYAHYAQLKNDPHLGFTVNGVTSGPFASPGVKSTGYEFGLRHSF